MLGLLQQHNQLMLMRRNQILQHQQLQLQQQIRNSLEDSSEPATGGSKFDMFPDAALNEKEEEEFPLHSCVKFGFLDFLEKELQKETTVVNAIDSRGRTALDLAALTGQLTLVTRLRNAGGIFQYKNGPRMLALANNRSKEMDKYLKCVRNSVG